MSFVFGLLAGVLVSFLFLLWRSDKQADLLLNNEFEGQLEDITDIIIISRESIKKEIEKLQDQLEVTRQSIMHKLDNMPKGSCENIAELPNKVTDSILALNHKEFNEIKELLKSVETPVLPEVDELIKYLNELPNRVTSQIINSMDKDKLEDFLKK